MKCSMCQKRLDEGLNILEVEEGIVGTSGFVPLDSAMHFCNEECMKEYFTASNGYDKWKVGRRVP
ncbi:hypothetical protein HYV49_04160 [Candidatus Pacearchaeota archaeon]|nr:hypothetical protein [Candidatus Pacearchaeota archaeon]